MIFTELLKRFHREFLNKRAEAVQYVLLPGTDNIVIPGAFLYPAEKSMIVK